MKGHRTGSRARLRGARSRSRRLGELKAADAIAGALPPHSQSARRPPAHRRLRPPFRPLRVSAIMGGV